MKNQIPNEFLEDDTRLEKLYKYYDEFEYDTIYDENNDYDNLDYGE